MSAFFASASSQKLLNAAPAITATPFTVGAWVYPTTTGTSKVFWSLADTATLTNYFTLGQQSTGVWRLEQTDDASPIAATTGTVVAQRWAFIVGRFISATNRTISVLSHTGAITHGTSTTSDIPLGIDAMALGCRNDSSPAGFFDGSVAEFWITNTDIQPGGAQLQNWMLSQLAYGGPFSIPHIAKDIIEYRSLWQSLQSNAEDWRDVYGTATKQIWANVGGVSIGPHPPLSGFYREMSKPRTTLAQRMLRTPLWVPSGGAPPVASTLRPFRMKMMGVGQ